jgi:hypothetical protein
MKAEISKYAWISFASAVLSRSTNLTPAGCAKLADSMLVEFDQRFAPRDCEKCNGSARDKENNRCPHCYNGKVDA